jgi:DNA polymerase-3 subunit beta
MEFTCQQHELLRGLSILRPAVAKQALLLISTDTQQGRLKLSATDLQIGIHCWIEAQVKDEGTTSVPARLFTELVQTLPAGSVQITLEPETHRLHLHCLATTNVIQVIQGLDPATFPLIPTVESDSPRLVLDASLLRELISQVAFAAARDESRPIFTGVLVQVHDEQLTFVATDALRLAARTVPLPGSTCGELLIPRRPLVELAHILRGKEPVEIIGAVDGPIRLVRFHTSQFDLISRLMEGSFSEHLRSLPALSPTSARVDARDFAASVKAAPAETLLLTVTPPSDRTGSGSVTLTHSDSEHRRTTLNATVDGEGISVRCSRRTLTDSLRVVGQAGILTIGVYRARHSTSVRLSLTSSPDRFYLMMARADDGQ